jgi:trans-aconitate 2-methyltransferase
MSSRPPPPSWNPELYDKSHSFVWKFGAALLELLEPKKGERILDLGCGTGALTEQIAAAGAEVVGIDSSAEMIAQARRSFPQLHFEVADARTFALEGKFDAVFSNAVLHWVREPERAVARIRAALKPGGRFVAEFGGKGNTLQLADGLQRQAVAFGIKDYEIPWYYPGIPEYTGTLERHGFEVTFATLFDRPTALEGEDGLRKWFEMFGGSLLDRLSPADRQACLTALETALRPSLYRDGTWFADYRRLRIVAQVVDLP